LVFGVADVVICALCVTGLPLLYVASQVAEGLGGGAAAAAAQRMDAVGLLAVLVLLGCYGS
jgi:hypothetical protein